MVLVATGTPNAELSFPRRRCASTPAVSTNTNAAPATSETPMADTRVLRILSGPYLLRECESQPSSDRGFLAATTERPAAICDGHTLKSLRLTLDLLENLLTLLRLLDEPLLYFRRVVGIQLGVIQHLCIQLWAVIDRTDGR